MSEVRVDAFIEEYSMLISIMFEEIEYQFRKAKGASNRLNEQLAQEPQEQDVNIIWHDLYQLAEAAAVISMILKPSPHNKRSSLAKELSINRGNALRNLLKVPSNHNILSRNLRNRLIHMDEDIDDWWIESKKHNIVRRFMTNSDPAKVFGGIEEREIFECFNYVTREFIYRGERFNTIVLWNALVDINKKLELAKVDMRDKYGSNFWGIPKDHPRA